MTIDLSTRYLGLKLANPLILGASPLGDRVDAVSRFAEAGAAAIVMYSLFEEQYEMESGTVRGADAPPPFDEQTFMRSVASYAAHISTLKRRVDIPVIASLNGYVEGPWMDIAGELAAAGADAIELNTYRIVTRKEDTAQSVEERLVHLVSQVKQRSGGLPVSVKLSPFYSSLPNLAVRLQEAGADGLVVFNRFYHHDFDVETMRLVPKVQFSDSGDLPLRLRWLSVLATCYGGSLGCSGGVHTTQDAIKALYAGADAVQLVSAALRRGPAAFTEIITGLTQWMERQGYADLAEVREAINPMRTPPSGAAVRTNYIRTIRSFDPWENLR